MSADTSTTNQVLETIYKENPSYWPHGLSIHHFDGYGDNLYLIKNSSDSNKVVGFVGWQERRKGGKNIGYYSIGILPSERNKGYTKEAVAALVDFKKQAVDEIQAYIVPGNTASEHLANALNIPIIKAASSPYSRTAAPGWLKGVGNFITQPFTDGASSWRRAGRKFGRGNFWGGVGSAASGTANMALGVASLVPAAGGASFVARLAARGLTRAPALMSKTRMFGQGGRNFFKGLDDTVGKKITRVGEKMEDAMFSPLKRIPGVGKALHRIGSTTPANKGFVAPLVGYQALDTAQYGNPFRAGDAPSSWSAQGISDRFNNPIAHMQNNPSSWYNQVPGVNLWK